ncbi:MIP/aquaporin family protein [Gemmatimonas groenlandica]|uniref:Aquaporin n=1 Tax=Gemmatimonas groenlandica TaxID=2732249 RepID=A0A6M4IU38_9BACT|nr:aquaporin [Gemmatimonas groenlandica]QJR37006.1 aquaporin [Gemmatimonas groenlandica]
MSDAAGRPDLRCYFAEALGTFALVAIGPGAAMVSASRGAFGHSGVALAFGLAVALIVAASGHLGGAHINPAVTLGFWSVRRFPTRDVLPYIIAQCTGAIAASALLGWLLGPVGSYGATTPSVSLARAFVIEMGYTGLLGFVIMAVATDDRAPGSVAPFVLGATVYAGALVTGPLTGGSFNPARTLGPAVFGGIWTAHWLYWAAPVVGMIAGMQLYNVVRRANVPSVASRGVATGVEAPL